MNRNDHSDDARFVATTSFLLEGAVPRVLWSRDMASVVMTGRVLCRCRDAGVDCVRE